MLPCNPAAYVGTAIHRMLELAFQGRISNRKELSEEWDNEIERLENEMLKNPLEKHLVPLYSSVLNFEVKKLLAFDMICPMLGGIPHGKSSGSKNNAEAWVDTPDGKVVGKIDLVKESDAGIEIVEYKTGPLTDDLSSGGAKHEYVIQVKMYAALYHAKHGEWPKKLTLAGINQVRISIDVDSEECGKLLQEASKNLADINELIRSGLQPRDFAQPSPETCKYCLFRPACSKYWEARKVGENWPIDAKGRIVNKTLLANGLYRVVIATDTGEAAIRGLSPERHAFLRNDIKRAVFCNLWNERSDGFFVAKMFTTGYVLE